MGYLMDATLAIDLFLAMDTAVRATVPMMPRSREDKEYFAQDWFADQAAQVPGLALTSRGRNSYPDFWAERGAVKEGYEIKALAFNNGKPARSDIDFNSSVPSGLKEGRAMFLVFFLYTGAGSDPRPVHSLVLAHGDLLNADHGFEHVNQSVPGFGSYGDGYIRNRKMYRFSHPLTLYPGGIGAVSLILPAGWASQDARVRRSDTLMRTWASARLRSYEIDLDLGTVTAIREPAQSAGASTPFDVYRRA